MCILKNNSMKKIVVLTGAGMSVESGLSTFRDADLIIKMLLDCRVVLYMYSFK